MAALLRHRNRCSNFHVFHQALDSALVYSNFCAASNSEDQGFLCDLVCDLVQFLLLRCISAYGTSSMRWEEGQVEKHMHRYLFSADYGFDYQCSFGSRDAYHSSQLRVEITHVQKTKIWAFHRICCRNSVSIKQLFWTLERS